MSRYDTHKRARLYEYAVNNTTCPKCGAQPGAPCLGTRGNYRAYPHIERQTVARAQRRMLGDDQTTQGTDYVYN